jgi:Uma2 family endonuclease
MVIRTFADLQKRLGDIPPDRIRMDPPPGTATTDDVTRIQAKDGVLCELVDGVLVEKTMGLRESILAMWIGRLLGDFVDLHKLGHVSGEAGTMKLMPGLVRIPDVAFISWDRVPGDDLPEDPIPDLVPNLAVEVLSASNTRGEMRLKRADYFSAGVEVVWEVDAKTRTVTVWTSETESTKLKGKATLDGGDVLPGLKLPLARVFAGLDSKKPKP